MSKVYVATFHGDLDHHPMVDNTLDSLLLELKEEFKWGEIIKSGWDEGCYITPDPEDDKVEIWEYDAENKTAKIVWGFWGWHWYSPEGMEQGKMPGDKESLFELAMFDY